MASMPPPPFRFVETPWTVKSALKVYLLWTCSLASLTIQWGLSVVFFFHMDWYAFVLTWSTFYTTGIKVSEIKLGPQSLELI